MSPIPIKFSSFFFDNLHALDRHDISSIFWRKLQLKIGLYILKFELDGEK